MRTRLVLYAPIADADTRTGKFLQLLWHGDEYLVFAQAMAYRYHNQILARFLAERGIAHHWRDEQTLEFDTQVLDVVGGGRFRVDDNARILRLWDQSQAYGRFAESELVQRIAAAAADHAWSTFRVDIA